MYGTMAVPAAADHTELTCWVCLEAGSDGEPLLRGCACRGGAGYAHLRCFELDATHSRQQWVQCRTCGQPFTGSLRLALARAFWATVSDRPMDDPDRLDAAQTLGVALAGSGAATGSEQALPLLLDVMQTQTRIHGPSHEDTLTAVTNLVAVYRWAAHAPCHRPHCAAVAHCV